MNGAPHGSRPPVQPGPYPPPHYPRPRRPRPIFAPRDYWFFISLAVLMVVAMIIYVWLTVYIYDSVNIECEVEVVVTLTGKESYEGTMVEVAVKHEDGEDYQPGSRRTLANPDGMANITITLTKTGRYTLTARFLDDSHSAPVTKELELVSDDDGGTKQIEMKLRWKP